MYDIWAANNKDADQTAHSDMCPCCLPGLKLVFVKKEAHIQLWKRTRDIIINVFTDNSLLKYVSHN